MSSDDGDPDERPVRPTLVDDFWLSDTTISWAAFCRLLDWTPPPERPRPTTPEQFFMDLYGWRLRHIFSLPARYACNTAKISHGKPAAGIVTIPTCLPAPI